MCCAPPVLHKYACTTSPPGPFEATRCLRRVAERRDRCEALATRSACEPDHRDERPVPGVLTGFSFGGGIEARVRREVLMLGTGLL